MFQASFPVNKCTQQSFYDPKTAQSFYELAKQSKLISNQKQQIDKQNIISKQKQPNKFIKNLLEELHESYKKTRDQKHYYERIIHQQQIKLDQYCLLIEENKRINGNNSMTSISLNNSYDRQIKYRKQIQELKRENLAYKQIISQLKVNNNNYQTQITILKKSKESNDKSKYDIQIECKGLKSLIEEYQKQMINFNNKIELLQRNNKLLNNQRSQIEQHNKDLTTQYMLLEERFNKQQYYKENINKEKLEKNQIIKEKIEKIGLLNRKIQQKQQEICSYRNSNEHLIVQNHKNNKNIEQQLLQIQTLKQSLIKQSNLYQAKILSLKEKQTHFLAQLETKWKKILTQEKKKEMEHLEKLKNMFETKKRLMLKFVSKICKDFRKQLQQLKRFTQRQMIGNSRATTKKIKQIFAYL